MLEEGFWKNLTKPIVGLAPMDGITDAAFRYMVATHGHPDVMFTEFTSVEGIRAGAVRLLEDFRYCEAERPIVAQLFGSDPAAFYIGAVVVAALGFDGADINMGCPAKNVAEKGAGGALIRDPKRAQNIVRQVQTGLRDWSEGISLAEAGVPDSIINLITPTERRLLPVSIKTRIGYDTVMVEDWIRTLLETEPAAISLHGRTLKQGYAGTADWDAIGSAAAIVHAESDTLILGNGDIRTLAQARERSAKYDTDGVLIGRGAFGNPWAFEYREASFKERMEAALEHARYLHTIMPGKGFIRIRKHLLDYCRGADGAKEMRQRLMKVESIADVEAILLQFAS